MLALSIVGLADLAWSEDIDVQAPQAAAAREPAATSSATTETGLAAVYSDKMAGHKTASGKAYDPDTLTVARKTVPFGTKVKVTKRADRVLDLSPRAARALGMHKLGMGEVELEVVQ